MKKFSMMLIGAVMAAGILTGCGTTQTEDEGAQARKELNDFIVGSRAAENIEKTGDKGIDAVADSSTIIYKRVGGAMREYIEKTQGTLTVWDMCRYLIDHPNETDEKYISAAQEIITRPDSALTDVEKKEWTAEELFKAGKEKNALNSYLAYEKGLKAAKDKAAYEKNYSDEKTQKELTEGKAIKQAIAEKEDWNAKIAEMENLLKDSGKIVENTAVLLQNMTKNLQMKVQESTALASDPAMQGYLQETVTLTAQKTFAGDARKKEIDAEIEKLATKAEYKPAMDKKALLEADMTKLKENIGVLTDGVGTQMKFTGKAIPWLISEYITMMGTEE